MKLTHGGDIYTYKEMFKREALDYSANINPLGMPRGVKEALIESIDSWANYPDPLCRKLKYDLAENEKVDNEYIILGNGAADIIFRLVYALKPKKAIVLAPTFSEYEEALTSVECKVQYHYLKEEDGFLLRDDFIECISDEIDMVFICNPNNPTGHVISSEDIIFILESFKDTLVVVDEAYYEFYGQSMIGYIEMYKNLVVTRTLSKAWGLAALRIGFLIANKELIKSLNLSKVPYNLNTFSQLVGCIVLRHPERILKNVEEIVHERERLYKRLNEIQKNSNDEIKFYKSKSNFIFGRTKNKEKLKKALEDKGILIRYFEDDSFRISVGSPLENDFIVNIIGNNMCEVREKCEENISN